MYAVNPKVLSKLAPQIRRVLVVDPNPAAARLLADLMRAAGAHEVLFEPDEREALELAETLSPFIIFVERSGPKLDGESFTRRLRRSDFACRKRAGDHGHRRRHGEHHQGRPRLRACTSSCASPSTPATWCGGWRR